MILERISVESLRLLFQVSFVLFLKSASLIVMIFMVGNVSFINDCICVTPRGSPAGFQSSYSELSLVPALFAGQLIGCWKLRPVFSYDSLTFHFHFSHYLCVSMRKNWQSERVLGSSLRWTSILSGEEWKGGGGGEMT